jgi:hypothetical protein
MWWPGADHHAEQRRNGRLVERDPPRDQVAEVLGDNVGVAREALHHGRVRPAAGLAQPQRVAEVMQRHDRRDAGRGQRFEDRPVVRQSRLVEAARRRLDARPLDREAIGVQLEPLEQRQILAPASPRIARIARHMGDQAGLFRLPPVGVAVLALRLMGGRRGAPQEPRGKPQRVRIARGAHNQPMRRNRASTRAAAPAINASAYG